MCGGLNGLTGCLSRHFGCRHPPKFLVDQRKQILGNGRIFGIQDAGNIRHGAMAADLAEGSIKG